MAPKCFGCHPDTWNALTAEQKEPYEVIDVDAERKETANVGAGPDGLS
jgi:hypothetical protein